MARGRQKVYRAVMGFAETLVAATSRKAVPARLGEAGPGDAGLGDAGPP